MWLIEPFSGHEYTKQPCDWRKVSDVHYKSVGRTLVCMAIIKQATITVTPCCIAGVMVSFLFCIRNFRTLDVVCLLEKKHFDNIWCRTYIFVFINLTQNCHTWKPMLKTSTAINIYIVFNRHLLLTSSNDGISYVIVQIIQTGVKLCNMLPMPNSVKCSRSARFYINVVLFPGQTIIDSQNLTSFLWN